MPARRRSTPRSSSGSSTASRATARHACGWTSRPWGPAKLLRKGGKHAAWIALSLATGLSFVGYFTPIHTWHHEHRAGLDALGAVLGRVLRPAATYGNAGLDARADVQVHVPICPLPERADRPRLDGHRLRPAPRREPRGGRARTADRKRAQDWATASTAACACRSAPPASTSATACRTNASAARPASTPATSVMDRLGYARGPDPLCHRERRSARA
jgi:hypothetical protein